MLKWITPSLAVGIDWAADDLVSADEATTWIQEGHSAIVADDATASEVLHNLGLSDNEIADRLRFAETGRVG